MAGRHGAPTRLVLKPCHLGQQEAVQDGTSCPARQMAWSPYSVCSSACTRAAGRASLLRSAAGERRRDPAAELSQGGGHAGLPVTRMPTYAGGRPTSPSGGRRRSRPNTAEQRPSECWLACRECPMAVDANRNGCKCWGKGTRGGPWPPSGRQLHLHHEPLTTHPSGTQKIKDQCLHGAAICVVSSVSIMIMSK